MNTSISLGQKQSNMSLIEFLLSTPDFNTLSYDELEMLDKIMLVDTYHDGHKFKSVSNVYLIIDGEVAVSNRETRGVMQLNRVYSGEIFGLFSLIDHSKRSATCTAVGPVRAASIPRSAFELLLRSKLPLANHFQRVAEHQMVHDIHAVTGAVHGNAGIF
jgi:CRP-like cAMP-binding protein